MDPPGADSGRFGAKDDKADGGGERKKETAGPESRELDSKRIEGGGAERDGERKREGSEQGERRESGERGKPGDVGRDGDMSKRDGGGSKATSDAGNPSTDVARKESENIGGLNENRKSGESLDRDASSPGDKSGKKLGADSGDKGIYFDLGLHSTEVAFALLTQLPRVQKTAGIFLSPRYFSHYCLVCGQYWRDRTHLELSNGFSKSK